MKASLQDIRRRIDAVDARLVALLNRRARLALEVGRLKARKGGSVYVPHRESEVLRRVASLNRGPLPGDALRAIYREIMSGAIGLERGLSIAYLGPPATFTHQAALRKFGSSVQYSSLRSITDVFAAVEKGSCDYGVVPIENSTEGAVTHTLDMFIDSDLKICSEVVLPISHHLLSRSPRSKIRTIYSKAEVFGQCRNWLRTEMPGAELVEASSTARAAETAAAQPGAAALASELAARLHGLKIIASDIQDQRHNVTRFLVIGKAPSRPTGNDKTSVLFSLKDKVGALHDALMPFMGHRINLTKIESRPSKRKAWEYYFFVDFSGHAKDPPVRRTLEELSAHCVFLKVLGSYPHSS